jgi:arylsulfatase A-like enzyme
MQRPPDDRPNILLIVVDTLRADHLGCYGYARPTSPNIDRLAAQGTLFEQVTAQSPWTLPSMASLHTSRYPVELGVTGVDSRLPAEATTLASLLARSGYETGAFVVGGYLDPKRGFEEGFGTYLQSPDHARAETVNQELFAWLDRPRDEPFFAWVQYFDVHSDYAAPPPWRERFCESPPPAELGTTELLKKVLLGKRRLTPAELGQVRVMYDQEIAYVDHEIGRVVEGLRRRELLDDTVVVVGADHGEAFSEHGVVLHTSVLYEELVHVPLIIRHPPAFKSGARSDRVAQNADIMPTLLSLARVSAPQSLRGSSLLAEDTRAPRLAFSHTDTASHVRRLSRSLEIPEAMSRALFSMRDGPRKILFNAGTGRFERYDLDRDPGEREDLHGAAPGDDGPLDRRLMSWIREQRSLGPARGPRIELGPEDRERLERLGYID